MSASSTPLERGVVSEVFPRFCNVILDINTESGTSTKKLLCTYRRAQIIDKTAEWRERSPVAPGDLVGVKILGSKDGVIEELYERKNCIQRRAPGKEGKVLHTIAANIDYVVIVSAFSDPDFSPGLIDRFLIATEKAGITPVVVINKMDLRTDLSERPWKIYEEVGAHCFPVSTALNEGVDELKAFLKAKISVFAGHSGVGKTSLLQLMYGHNIGKIAEISKSSGKGKHTTTVSTLIQTEDKTRFIDTPGIKEFGLIDIDPKELILFYPELHALQLKHEEYKHLPRYESYMRIKAALEDEGR